MPNNTPAQFKKIHMLIRDTCEQINSHKRGDIQENICKELIKCLCYRDFFYKNKNEITKEDIKIAHEYLSNNNPNEFIKYILTERSKKIEKDPLMLMAMEVGVDGLQRKPLLEVSIEDLKREDFNWADRVATRGRHLNIVG